MVKLAIFVRKTHDAGTRGESRAATDGKPRVGGCLTRQPFWRVPDTGALDIEKRLGDLHCLARVSHCAEPEFLA